MLDRSPNRLREELLEEPFVSVGGCVAVPRGDGLGIRVNESKLAEFAE